MPNANEGKRKRWNEPADDMKRRTLKISPLRIERHKRSYENACNHTSSPITEIKPPLIEVFVSDMSTKDAQKKKNTEKEEKEEVQME